jgi:PPOX class probable F420-dependent enzyme
MSSATRIPESHRDLLTKKSFAHLATLNADGSPQSTPVWIDHDGTHVLVNTARGRRKDRNMRQRLRVALSITDPENPYRYLEVRGTVVEATEAGADAHIDKLAARYLNAETYPFRTPGEVRVIFKIRPEHATTTG